jgi:starch synthase
VKVLFASAEVAPFSKVGGLGDVAGALPKALAELGADVRVITPRYGSINARTFGAKVPASAAEFDVGIGADTHRAALWQATLPGSAVPVYFVESRTFFGRPGIYQDPATGAPYSDEASRFAFFGRAILRAAEVLRFRPEVIHLNDFHTATAVGYLRYAGDEHPTLRNCHTVFTIHNLGYQGQFPLSTAETIGMPAEAAAPMGPLEFFGKMNFMKLGIALADAITTVSPTYAQEIQESHEFGMGLEGVLRSRSEVVRGILNGIDYEVWNPEADVHIPGPYSAADLSGKAVNRAKLLETFGWPAQSREPVVAMIGRLAAQKGWDLVLDAGRRMVKLGLRLAVLGTGDKQYEKGLTELSKRHPGRVGAALRFDEALAHVMEAGADLFLMPSRYEPCGLNQMISLRYGTVPVVRATGGLRDTVVEFDPSTGRGNGFLFRECTSEAMLEALARALKLFGRPDAWQALVRNAMSGDHSWAASAREYLKLYRSLIP